MKNKKNMNEIFKDVPEYEGIYQVSNFGNVKSLKYGKDRMMKHSLNGRGRLQVTLCKDCKRKIYKVHQLVAMSFLGHTPNGYKLVVDHIDSNPLNNHVDNLQLISNRENTSRGRTDCGVHWDKARNKWRARIWIGDKNVHLGYFIDKQDGINMYQKALENMHLYNGDKKQFKNQII